MEVLIRRGQFGQEPMLKFNPVEAQKVFPPVPEGYEEIVGLYGMPPADPEARKSWEKENIVSVKIPFAMPLSWDKKTTIASIQAHKVIAPVVSETFTYLYLSGACKLITSYGGSYNYRVQRGGNHLSTHSWGCAFDLNPETNKLGQVPKMPAVLVMAIKAFGWIWGGEWNRPDGMHFQYATKY